MALAITSLPRNPSFAQGLGLALAGAALITLGAKVQIPFWPVPMTLHTLSVFLVALTLGPRLGLAAMAAYLGPVQRGFRCSPARLNAASGLAIWSGRRAAICWVTLWRRA